MAKKEKKIPTLAEFEKKNPPAVVEVDRKVKVKAVRAFEHPYTKKVIEPNMETLLSEDEAKVFCDEKFDGYHPFHGYMPYTDGLLDGEQQSPLQRKQIVRAVRI